MSIQFTLIDTEYESGVFDCHDELFRHQLEAFDSLLNAHQGGQLDDKCYIAELNRLITAAPDFIDVYAHIAYYWYNQGKPKKALDAALLGLGVANRYIPEGFKGLIEWSHIGNRPYLRAMHAALLCYTQLRRHSHAAMLISVMLERNPNDNQGVRYLLGSEALRAGNIAQAYPALEAAAESYPPCLYELALCHIIQEDWVAAATALRRGFVANQYIAEILAGNPAPAKLVIRHESNFAQPEIARDYIQMYGTLWYRQHDSRAFVRWLFNHPAILIERAAILKYQEAILWEKDPAVRVQLGEQAFLLKDNIDNCLSAEIVIKRTDRYSNVMWPWLSSPP